MRRRILVQPASGPGASRPWPPNGRMTSSIWLSQRQLLERTWGPDPADTAIRPRHADGSPGRREWRTGYGLAVSAQGRAVAFSGRAGKVWSIDEAGDRVGQEGG